MRAITFMLCLSFSVTLYADLFITEIMYNPDSSEPSAGVNPVEWVEIWNSGPSAVDMTGMMLADTSDGAVTDGFSSFTLAAGGVVILTPLTDSEFEAAWGSGIDTITWTASGSPPVFANGPSGESDEVVALLSSTSAVIDDVPYDDGGDWPSDSPDGPSIYLTTMPTTETDNDSGTVWARSVSGTDGAFGNTVTSDFDGADIGSPGVVPSSFTATAVPEPGSMALLAILGAAGALAHRRREDDAPEADEQAAA